VISFPEPLLHTGLLRLLTCQWGTHFAQWDRILFAEYSGPPTQFWLWRFDQGEQLNRITVALSRILSMLLSPFSQSPRAHSYIYIVFTLSPSKVRPADAEPISSASSLQSGNKCLCDVLRPATAFSRRSTRVAFSLLEVNLGTTSRWNLPGGFK